MKTFPKRVADKINAILANGRFAVMSSMAFHMRKPKYPQEDGWIDATPQYNYDKLAELKRLLISKGASFTAARNVSECADPYSLLVLGVTNDEALAIAKEAGIRHLLLGGVGGYGIRLGCFVQVMTSDKTPGMLVEGSIPELAGAEVELRSFVHGGALATHYYEQTPESLGWLGAWAAARANDLEGLVELAPEPLSGDKLNAGYPDLGGKGLKASYLASLIKL